MKFQRLDSIFCQQFSLLFLVCCYITILGPLTMAVTGIELFKSEDICVLESFSSLMGSNSGQENFNMQSNIEVKMCACKLARWIMKLSHENKKILSYDVWLREDLGLHKRMNTLGDLIQLHPPDLICFQLSRGELQQGRLDQCGQ
ncbi:hypothetical protein ACSBR2_016135 [Camellia fascicularis]